DRLAGVLPGLDAETIAIASTPKVTDERRIQVEQTMTRGRVRVEHGRKRVRAYLGGVLAADTTSPLLVWEVPYYPAYYIPARDMRADLVPTGAIDHSPSRGDAEVFDLRTPAATAPSAALRYADSPVEELREAVRLDWDAMDEWLEEDEPVYTHPRDPYTRAAILASSRHVRVDVDGVTVADSRQPRILFETGLPPRYYLPLADVRLDLLRPSATQVALPVQGHRQLLVPGYRTRNPQGLRLDLPVPAGREPEDRRARLFLQREGRPLRRRSPPGAAAHKIQLPEAGRREASGVAHRHRLLALGRRVTRALRPAATQRQENIDVRWHRPGCHRGLRSADEKRRRWPFRFRVMFAGFSPPPTTCTYRPCGPMAHRATGWCGWGSRRSTSSCAPPTRSGKRKTCAAIHGSPCRSRTWPTPTAWPRSRAGWWRYVPTRTAVIWTRSPSSTPTRPSPAAAPIACVL